MAQPLLQGEVDNRDDIILDLQRENRRLIGENRRMETELATVRAQTNRAIAGIRHQMKPWYDAMKALFGEMDAISGGAEEVAQTKPSVWEAWKQRLTPNAGKIIDALLAHRDLSSVQISVATGIGQGNVAKYVWELNRAGIINKVGGRISLKTLP